MLINKANLDALFVSYSAAFNQGFRTAAPEWNKVATLAPSSSKRNDYAWLEQWPKLREWVGDRQVKNIASHGYSILNKDFESTVGVPANDISDDQYGVYSPLMQEMGYAAATHPDELVFGLLAGAFTTACYDGQYMVDTDHPVGSGVVSNHGGGAGNAWFLIDGSRPLKPLIYQLREAHKFQAMTSAEDESVFTRKEFRYGVDARCNVGFGFWQQIYGSKDTLNATNFDAAVAAMMAFQSDEGRPLGIRPTMLVCGPSNRAAARGLLEVERLTGGASNPNYKAVELLVTPLLA